MNQVNRANPMMIILRQESDKTRELSKDGIKNILIFGITDIISILIGTLYSVILNQSILFITLAIFIFNILVIGSNFIELYRTIQNNGLRHINEMIYGNKYATLDLNLEDVYATTRKICEINGKIKEMILSIQKFGISIPIYTAILLLGGILLGRF